MLLIFLGGEQVESEALGFFVFFWSFLKYGSYCTQLNVCRFRGPTAFNFKKLETEIPGGPGPPVINGVNNSYCIRKGIYSPSYLFIFGHLYRGYFTPFITIVVGGPPFNKCLNEVPSPEMFCLANFFSNI